MFVCGGTIIFWGSLRVDHFFSLVQSGGSEFFHEVKGSDQNFFLVRKGGPFFLPWLKGGPEKIGDSSSQIDAPPPSS